ncbi:DUF6115 domain-containing protein [Domibacillus sp.]|uniref:DUF6115 domain-containing protein n=1 Tax=Domibacillus sp. TaxID=1969783 RepID=UPI00281261F5|nr:hypothetical protein [Domibacillus sp.]
MTIFLITISFLIHAMSLFALIILFQRQNKISDSEKKAKQAAKDMEEMMTAFLIEIKEENEQLISKLGSIPPAKKPNAKDLEPREKPLPPLTPRKAAAKAYTGMKTVQVERNTEKEVPQSKKIADMKEQGMTEEEIAKTLHIGITEVQLALKFNKTEGK